MRQGTSGPQPAAAPSPDLRDEDAANDGPDYANYRVHVSSGYLRALARANTLSAVWARGSQEAGRRSRGVEFAHDLYGAFPVKRLLLGFAHSSLFGGVSR